MTFDPVAAVDAALAARASRQAEVTRQLSFELKRPSRRKLSMELARHIRRLRKEQQWSHQELSELAGVSRRTIGYVLAEQLYREKSA